MKDKVLVTGSSGFLGAQLVKQLVHKGYHVVALKRESSKTSHLADLEGQFDWFTGDILDVFSLEEAMKGVRYVYHSAAMISFDNKEKYQMFKVNIEGTANVINAAIHAGVEKFLHVSSINAFGTYKTSKEISEKTKWKEDSNNTNYAISKQRSELEVWRGKEEGLNVLIVNPSTILGISNWETGSAQIFKQIYDGIPFYPKGSNGFVGVEDTAKVSIKLMESDIVNEQFIINAENKTFKDLFEKIAFHFDRKAPKKELSNFIREIGWRYYFLKAKLTNSQAMITEKTTLFTSWEFRYDSSKLHKAIDFKFEPIDSVIERTCAYFKSKK